MNRGIISRAWGDVRHSPHWFAKMCLLGLVSLIPVFGIIVVLGYLFGWARDAAWGMDNPLPASIVDNEDGQLYRRGFFALLISVVMSVAVSLAITCVTGIFETTMGIAGLLPSNGHGLRDGASVVFAMPVIIGSLGLMLVSIFAECAVRFFIWAGTMRMSIYGTLSSGFQMRRLWAMIRKDPVGLFKVFLMRMIAGFFVVLIVMTVWLVLLFAIATIAIVATGMTDVIVTETGISHANSFDAGAAIAMVLMVMAMLFLALFFLSVCMAAITAVSCRALGHWAAQFGVASWGSQHECLPFEREGGML